MPFTPPSMGYSGIPDYTFRKSSSPFSHNYETAPGSNTFVWKAPPVAPPPNALSAADIQAVRGAFASKGIDPFPWFGQSNNAPPPIPGTGASLNPQTPGSEQMQTIVDYAPPNPGNPIMNAANQFQTNMFGTQENTSGLVGPSQLTSPGPGLLGASGNISPQLPNMNLDRGNMTGPPQPQFQSPLGNYEYPFKQGAKSPQYPF